MVQWCNGAMVQCCNGAMQTGIVAPLLNTTAHHWRWMQKEKNVICRCKQHPTAVVVRLPVSMKKILGCDDGAGRGGSDGIAGGCGDGGDGDGDGGDGDGEGDGDGGIDWHFFNALLAPFPHATPSMSLTWLCTWHGQKLRSKVSGCREV